MNLSCNGLIQHSAGTLPVADPTTRAARGAKMASLTWLSKISVQFSDVAFSWAEAAIPARLLVGRLRCRRRIGAPEPELFRSPTLCRSAIDEKVQYGPGTAIKAFRGCASLTISADLLCLASRPFQRAYCAQKSPYPRPSQSPCRALVLGQRFAARKARACHRHRPVGGDEVAGACDRRVMRPLAYAVTCPAKLPSSGAPPCAAAAELGARDAAPTSAPTAGTPVSRPLYTASLAARSCRYAGCTSAAVMLYPGQPSHGP